MASTGGRLVPGGGDAGVGNWARSGGGVAGWQGVDACGRGVFLAGCIEGVWGARGGRAVGSRGSGVSTRTVERGTGGKGFEGITGAV